MIWTSLFFIGAAVVIYHHFLYPRLLKLWAARASGVQYPQDQPADVTPLNVAVIVPAYNEARFIADKLRQLARLDYPRDRLKIILASDGSQDETVRLAHAVAMEAEFAGLDLSILDFATNRGKIAVLNEVIAKTKADIILLTDASAQVESDILARAVPYFTDDGIGVVCPTYVLPDQASTGEKAYWDYQRAIKINEAKLGAPIGAHGAGYLFRRDLWQPLEPDTINDDVILPMRIVERGWVAIYDPAIVLHELESTGAVNDFKRRVRIGSGNMQQALRLWRLASPFRPGLAFAFLSGKFLRAIVPFLLALMLLSSAVLAWTSLVWALVTTVALAAMLVGVMLADAGPQTPKSLVWLSYFIIGHIANGWGGLLYLVRPNRSAWRRVTVPVQSELDYVHPVARVGKRALDIVCALLACIAFFMLVIPTAIAIKLESKGPIFYRQLRVGRRGEHSTELFWLIKFRTMRADAETKSGAVWATAQDPRVTRFGRFMRKSRLDELPQCFNVLRGEMSIVGPRPERPQFFTKLEQQIPFYIERTYGLKPGITGLAQVSQGYDTSIEDVRSKAMYDHAYAMRIVRPWDWLKTDISIVIRTFTVMVLGKGQ